jgi:hypothetical protein
VTDTLVPPTPSERRSAPRFPARPGTAVDCRTAGGPGLATGLIDISAGGCRLTVAARLDPGQAVGVSFRPPGGPDWVRRAGAVCWCLTGLGAGTPPDLRREAGVLFNHPLTDAELASLTLDARPG